MPRRSSRRRAQSQVQEPAEPAQPEAMQVDEAPATEEAPVDAPPAKKPRSSRSAKKKGRKRGRDEAANDNEAPQPKRRKQLSPLEKRNACLDKSGEKWQKAVKDLAQTKLEIVQQASRLTVVSLVTPPNEQAGPNAAPQPSQASQYIAGDAVASVLNKTNELRSAYFQLHEDIRQNLDGLDIPVDVDGLRRENNANKIKTVEAKNALTAMQAEIARREETLGMLKAKKKQAEILSKMDASSPNVHIPHFMTEIGHPQRVNLQKFERVAGEIKLLVPDLEDILKTLNSELTAVEARLKQLNGLAKEKKKAVSDLEKTNKEVEEKLKYEVYMQTIQGFHLQPMVEQLSEVETQCLRVFLRFSEQISRWTLSDFVVWLKYIDNKRFAATADQVARTLSEKKVDMKLRFLGVTRENNVTFHQFLAECGVGENQSDQEETMAICIRLQEKLL